MGLCIHWICIYWSFSVKKPLQNYDFIKFLHVFQPSFDDNSAICWSILMQNSVLERLLVVENMTEIWI
jgi:hypothetical protein